MHSAKVFSFGGIAFLEVNNVVLAVEGSHCWDGHYNQREWSREMLEDAATAINTEKYVPLLVKVIRL